MRYYDPVKKRPIITGEPTRGGEFLDTEERAELRGIATGWIFARYTAEQSALRGNPEAQLVQRYIKWIGSPSHFLTAKSTIHGGVIDLFNRTTWTLIEAKSSIADRYVREAFGQLYDYRRSFVRSPSLAVLLPEAPSARVRNFLTHFGVRVIWETPASAFADSDSGKLSKRLRSAYAARAR
jgi:hypothetical protein